MRDCDRLRGCRCSGLDALSHFFSHRSNILLFRGHRSLRLALARFRSLSCLCGHLLSLFGNRMFGSRSPLHCFSSAREFRDLGRGPNSLRIGDGPRDLSRGFFHGIHCCVHGSLGSCWNSCCGRWLLSRRLGECLGRSDGRLRSLLQPCGDARRQVFLLLHARNRSGHFLLGLDGRLRV